MRVGCPREIKDSERRVGLTPSGVAALVGAGHTVAVEHGAGLGSGLTDDEYRRAGAEIVDAAGAWAANLVVKVKEPLPGEFAHLERQMLFTYLHLAGVEQALTDALLAAGTTAIAYEAVQDSAGRLPLLAPMSAVAGSMAPLVGAHYLATPQGGRGQLLARLDGQRHGKVLIVGDGIVARHAARAAAGLGTKVVLLVKHADRIAPLRAIVGPDPEYAVAGPESIIDHLRDTDLLVGAVRLALGRAPRVISESMVRVMPAGSVIVDVSIDQGGCCETSRPTSHSKPVYIQHGVVHYCVPNMPGAYPRTSTSALTAATLPYVRLLAERGEQAFRQDPLLGRAVYTHRGFLTCRAVGDAFGLALRYRDLTAVLGTGGS